MAQANDKLKENSKDLENNQKYYTEKANEKHEQLKEGSEKFMKSVNSNT